MDTPPRPTAAPEPPAAVTATDVPADAVSAANADPETKPTGTVPATPEKTRWQRLRGPLAVSLGLGAGVLLLRAVDPHEPGVYPVCPTKILTGIDCPGCGGLRATNELAHGDVAAAIDDNALVVAAVPIVVLLLMRAFFFAWTGRTPARMTPRRARMWTYLVIGIVLVFSIVRNLPGSFLASG